MINLGCKDSDGFSSLCNCLKICKTSPEEIVDNFDIDNFPRVRNIEKKKLIENIDDEEAVEKKKKEDEYYFDDAPVQKIMKSKYFSNKHKGLALEMEYRYQMDLKKDREEKESYRMSDVCEICGINKPCIIFNPCNHNFICDQCCVGVTDCSLCGQFITAAYDFRNRTFLWQKRKVQSKEEKKNLFHKLKVFLGYKTFK